MATLRDLGYVIRNFGAWKFGKRVYGEINSDNVFTNAAAIAYAWMFAIFPFFIFLLTLVPYFPVEWRGKALQKLYDLLQEGMTPKYAGTIVDFIKQQVADNPNTGFLSFGLLLTLYAASGGMNTTMSALDQAFDVQKPRAYILKRLIAMGLTVFMCACLVVIIVMVPVGTIVTNILLKYSDRMPAWLNDIASGPSLVLLTLARYIIGLTVMQILIGVLYHYGRSERQRRVRFFTPGSIFCAVGWIGTGLGMRYYLEHFGNYSKTYGAVAGMVIMLMIFYVDAIVVLIGAEIDSEIQHTRAELVSHFREDSAVSRPHA